MLRHLFPNVLGTVLVMASYYIAITVIAEAGFSFIGLGAQPPTPSLGQMIVGRPQLPRRSASGPAIVPGITIALHRAGAELPRRRPARHLRPAAAAD